MARGSDTLSRVASVADYNSDDGEIAGTRKQANVAAKRSGGLGKDQAAMTTPQQHVAVPDLSSESGYSARTRATVGSTDSDTSAPVPSEVHTATSSNSHGDEIVVRNGKKYRVCKDPNCTKSHHHKKSGKPPKSHAMSPPRQKSPARSDERDDPRPQLRQRSATAGEARKRPNSIHGAILPHGYLPPPHPMQPNPYWMAAHMVVNRTMPLPPERPGAPHRNSTRRVNAQPLYGEPLPKQKPKVTMSMRTPVDPPLPPPEDDDEAYEEEVDRRLRRAKERELDALERERKAVQAEWRAVQQAWLDKQDADRAAMPPPPPLPLRSAMRRPSTVAPPKVTYDDDDDYGSRYHHVPRPPSNPTVKSYSHERGYDPADAQRLSKYRRKSLVSNDRILDYATARMIEDAELGRRHRELTQVNARASRESQTIGGDSDDISDRLDHLTLDQSTRPKVDSKIHAAEHYMGRSKEESRYPLTERAMRKSGLDRDAASTRSKRISKDGSTTTATAPHRQRSVRSNSSSRAPPALPTPSVVGAAAAAGFQLRIDTGQKYDLEVGEGQHITLHPTPEGSMNLVYHGGRRETPYPSTRASTSTTTGSRVGRSLSQRSAGTWRPARDVPAEVIVDDDDEEDDDDDDDDDDDEEEEEDEPLPPPPASPTARRQRAARPSETRRAGSRERRWMREEQEQRQRQQQLQQQRQQQEQQAAAAAARRPAPGARRMSRREDERPTRPSLAQGGERRAAAMNPRAAAMNPRAAAAARQHSGGYASVPPPSTGPFSAPAAPAPPQYGQGHGYFGGGGNYHGFGA
jgi:hypothetical protein